MPSESQNDAAQSSPLYNTQADLTYETNVTNNQFLEAIFGNMNDIHQPILVSFPGSPAKVDQRNWRGQDWKRAIECKSLQVTSNNYFSLGRFSKDEKGNYSRKKKNFVSLHAVFLDDLGTKVPMDNVKLEPSSLIETSQGNFQALYILSEPITDLSLADKLFNAIISAGLSDPGASGPAARLARLPIAINGKYSEPFVCRLAVWKPQNRYTVDDLIKGLGIESLFQSGVTVQSKTKKMSRLEAGDSLYTPAEGDNPVLTALKQKGLWKTPLGDGKHDLTCPWVTEHTNIEDHGTAYFEPEETFPVGGFSCLHGHCKERSIKDLLAYLEIAAMSARMKSTIYVEAGEMGPILDAAECALVGANRYYQRGGAIVIITTDPGTRETAVTAIKTPSIRVALSNAANWVKRDADGEYFRIDPPSMYSTALRVFFLGKDRAGLNELGHIET